MLSIKPVLVAVLIAGFSAAIAAGSDQLGHRSISTWYAAKDLKASLAELQLHSTSMTSLSLTAVGNASNTAEEKQAFMKAVAELGIDTYVLWGGDLNSFYTAEARDATVTKCLQMVADGHFTGIDLDFEHLPQNASVSNAYTTFLLHLSAALHKKGRKLSACVGSYPTAEGGISVFYDPAVINATCNVVRVMNYDMYYVGGRGVQSLKSRPDCAGVGPTSTVPWAKFSMEWWSARVSVEKLVMGLPAYSNDYSALPHFGGGNGTQQGVGPPNEGAEALKGSVESTWEFFDQIYVHHYSDATVQGNPPRIRYGTDARSTKSQLKTADALGIKQVGFWTWNSASAEMMDTLYNWTAAKEFPTPPSVVASAATPALMPFDILPANASLPP
eukprot:gene26287-26476_t